MSLPWRFPDLPQLVSANYLHRLEAEGGYIATFKKDGYACIIDWDGNEAHFFSRRSSSTGPTEHPVSKDVKLKVANWFKENNISSDSRMMGEWADRRAGNSEEIFIFGIHFLNGEWMGKQSEQERWNLISSFKYGDIKLVESANSNYLDFFEESITDPFSEGIVLKHANSKLIGDINSCRDNPLWLKVKWRSGSAGDTIIYKSRSS